jgi:hypothetical protein
MKRTGAVVLGAIIAITVILSSCKDDVEDHGTPPELPPQASLSVNLGNFPQNGSGRIDQTTASGHFAFSALNVVFWQSIVGASIALPAVAFEAAIDHPFQYSEADGKWVSTYTIGSGQLMTAELFAEVTGETVIWEMYLSQEDSFDRFLWFTGESNLDNTGGAWVLYASPERPVEILTIDWDRVAGDAVNSLYTLVDSGNSKNGSYVAYGLTSETGFTHYYDVSVVDTEGDDYDLYIYFDEETKQGKVKSTAYFGDEGWRCWDEALEDTDC